MGMHVTVDVADPAVTLADFDAVYDYFTHIDDTFSTYKDTSAISRINQGKLLPGESSPEVQTVLSLSDQTKRRTGGFFDINNHGYLDPSGLVKGWAIKNAAKILSDRGLHNFYVDAGGDIQVSGYNAAGLPLQVGIRNPFNSDQIVKVLSLSDCGIATSGTSRRGQHIYNPHRPGRPLADIVSLTVIGPDIYEADRFATAAFAMGPSGIDFIRTQLPGFSAYMIDNRGLATYTPS